MAPAADGEAKPLPSWNIVVICTVGGVLMFELLCQQMNNAAHGKKHAMELLEGLYRELAILGVVAFVLWTINVSDYVTIEYNDKHLFEEIHMTLFLAALFHSFFVGMVALYARQTMRRWDIFEDDEMRRYKDLKQQYRRTAAQLGIRHSQLKRGVGLWKWARLWTSHPMLCRRLSELSEHVSYHAIRSQFIKDNQLPKNFRFAAYLKKCEQEVVIELAEIKHGVWVGLILFVGIELYIKGLIGEAKSNADVKGLFLFAAAMVMLAALGVHFKLQQIYKHLVHSYQASTDKRDDLAQYLGPDSSASIRQQDMFWFGKPHLMLTALQTMQFLLAVMVGALIWFGAGESEGLVIVAEILLAVGAIAIYTIVLPRFIPKFTKVTHIGGMVNRHILSETLVKQKKTFQRRALPPTLRQVSVMARLKSNEAMENGLLVGMRKFMSGHMFREVVQVLVAIHFFVVAYNAEPVEEGYGDGKAWTTEIVFAAFALAVEIATHFVVWRGKACFHLNPFVEVPDRMVNAPLNTAASIHPSNSRRQLLAGVEDGSNADDKLKQVSPPVTSTATVMTSVGNGSGMDKEGMDSSSSPADAAAASRQRETHTVCSIWACFGWRGGDYAAAGAGGCCRCLDGIPPQAVVGSWRSLDLALVLIVLACAITTGLVDGFTREVIHAIQGIVIVRLWPLWRCPLPPAVGHDDLHDVHGATVHNAPLDKHTRESVMQETLTLLRGQNPQEGSFEARALMAGTTNDDSDDEDPVGLHDRKAADKLSGEKPDKQGTIEEEKDEDMSSDEEDNSNADGIANVGVAMALRDACTSHPDLVHTHGPLSAPILRAMLGLDPYKNAKQDDGKALAVAARAVALARGLSRSDAGVMGPTSGEEGGGASRMRRQSSAAVAPSPAPSSTASSDLSDNDSDDDGGDDRDRKTSGVSQSGGGRAGRLSSFMGGGGRYREQQVQQQMQQQQQQQQQQLMLYQQQMQFQIMQQQQLKELQYQQYNLGQQSTMASLESGTAYVERPPSTHSMDHSQLGMLQSAHRVDYTPAESVSGVSQAWIGSGPAVNFIPRPTHLDAAASAPALSSNSMASARSFTSARKGRSRSRRRAPSGTAATDTSGGIMAASVEDLERPVLPSFAGSTSSQHGPSKAGGTGPGAGRNASPSGAAGGRVPFSSGRSVPYVSGHQPSRRGTPARLSRGSGVAGGGGDQPALAASEDYLTGNVGIGRGFGGGIEEGEGEMSVSDGTASGSGASAAAEKATTPSAYDGGGSTTSRRKKSIAE